MFSVSSHTVATTMQVLCVFGFLSHLLESWLCKWKSYPLSLFYMLYLSSFYLLSQLLCLSCGTVWEDSKSTELLIIES